jgi:uncharacterized protein YkwD
MITAVGLAECGFRFGTSKPHQPFNVRKSIRSGAHAVARSTSRLFAVSLFLVLCFAGTVGAAEEADRSALEEYAIWANRSLKSLPEGVQLLEPLARRLVELTSVRRREADADLEPLQTDPELLPAARAHALDMLERGYFDHVTPAGLDPSDRVALLHRRLVGGVGENLAEHRGLSADQLKAQVGHLAVKIMDGLMQSPAHRENILNPEYTHLAIAAVAQGEGLVVVQLFEARRALLAERLPLHVRQGEKLPLKFEQRQDLAVPAEYAYARPGQSVQELVALDLSSDEVAVEPGVYFLKFLFPTEQTDRFDVVAGPALFVR